MNLNNLRIEVDPRLDKEGEVYYIGRLRAPISIDLTEGVTFLVFLSKSGEEELQVAPNDKENTTFSRYTIRGNKMKVRLDRREDKDGKIFYVCKVRHPGRINCLNEACFMVFTSRQNNEELQITGEVILDDEEKPSKHKQIEVIRR